MRVVVLADYGHITGGASQVAVGSLNSLAEAGMDVVFVSGTGPVDPTIHRDKVEIVNFGLYDILQNPSKVDASIKGIWNSQSAERVREVLATCDPADTIVHLHTWTRSLSSSVVHAVASLGFKMVCTLHDYFAICPNGGLYIFPEEKHCQLRPMSLSCVACNCDTQSYAQKLWRVGRHLVQQQLGGIPSQIKYFITVSDYSEKLLRPWLPSSSEFFRVSNPIQVVRTAPAPVGSNHAFTFVGRLSKEKGPDLFAEAALLANVPAVFVGSGPRLENVAAINKSATLLGWKDQAGVASAFQGSRALVFPSLWHETQGLSVLEAAASGVPAIVSDACAAREAIIDGETGLLFRSGDASDLSAKLTLLDRDAAFAARIGSNAYNRYWSAPSTLESHTSQLIACYQKILKRD
ncbi:glycosyltransferase [Acidicapsa ligni]|uniref:glycosyltransferase n=1 Tax=Acidicapsa ligni TaxID=542300 RepID=UPI0021E0772D|nr:glycosyltransferase [Acidicapsa ligni]